MGHVREQWILGPAGRLEARLRIAAPARAAAVLAHPHPLHGGTLHNPVMFHADRELNRAGLTTLRFNFRGVGASEGEHDGGRGEVDDLAHAAAWLAGESSGLPLFLVGYSFGAMCALRLAVREQAPAGVIAIGLATRIDPLEEIARLERPLAVVQGDADELGPLDEVRERLSRAGGAPSHRIVAGATHLFPGRAPDAAREVVAAAEELLSRVNTDLTRP